MSDHLHDYRCLLEGEITLDSTAAHNTSGAFCDLFTATHPTAGKLALKRPRGNHNERLVAHVEIEAGVWASLKHPRILQFLGIHKIGNDVYLVSAFAENGSLPGFLERRPAVDRRRLVIEIAEGLTYLHQCGIIHGDLKGNNVLISGGEHIRLCDFGLAKHVTSRTSTSLRGVGSIPWQSPELLQDASRRTFQSDVYAFGITVYEVLSGKEPYSHHIGIVSIITGVVFNGERPPKEPEVALDGSSYLQFWDEASKCWAEDSSLRPRIIDLLNRLDRRRAEILVTSQQRVLEESLIPAIEAPPISQLHSAPELPPPGSDGANKQDTLDWAHRIRVRMNLLVNAQKPVYRIPPEVIIKIIENDLGPSDWKDSSNWGFQFVSCVASYVRHVVRCAELGTVCKAWHDAIENTPELTGSILLDGSKNNINYVKRCNRDSQLEIFLKAFGGSTWSGLSSLLGPLASRVRSLNMCWGELSFGFPSFPMLRVVRLVSVGVSDTFAVELLGMLHANQDLLELTLDGIVHRGSGAEDWPRLRIDHSGLQRVRLTRLWAPLQSHILHCLGLKTSVILKIDRIRPEDLVGPHSAFRSLLRSLGLTRLSAPRDAVPSPGGYIAIGGYNGSYVTFEYAVHDHALLHGGQSPRSGATSWCSQLKSDALATPPYIVNWVRLLRDSGIEPKSAALESGLGSGEDAVPADLLRCLSPITTLTIELELGGLCGVLRKLGQSQQKDAMDGFLCPNLMIMDIKNARIGSGDFHDIYDLLCSMVQNRHRETRPTNGLAKLQKIRLPEAFHMEHDFSGSVFEGIEIDSKGGR